MNKQFVVHHPSVRETDPKSGFTGLRWHSVRLKKRRFETHILLIKQRLLLFKRKTATQVCRNLLHELNNSSGTLEKLFPKREWFIWSVRNSCVDSSFLDPTGTFCSFGFKRWRQQLVCQDSCRLSELLFWLETTWTHNKCFLCHTLPAAQCLPHGHFGTGTGFDPPTFWLVDDPLYLPSQSFMRQIIAERIWFLWFHLLKNPILAPRLFLSCVYSCFKFLNCQIAECEGFMIICIWQLIINTMSWGGGGGAQSAVPELRPVDPGFPFSRILRTRHAHVWHKTGSAAVTGTSRKPVSHFLSTL